MHFAECIEAPADHGLEPSAAIAGTPPFAVNERESNE